MPCCAALRRKPPHPTGVPATRASRGAPPPHVASLRGRGAVPVCRARRNASTRAPSRLGAEPHSPFLFTCQTAHRRVCAAAHLSFVLSSPLALSPHAEEPRVRRGVAKHEGHTPPHPSRGRPPSPFEALASLAPQDEGGDSNQAPP